MRSAVEIEPTASCPNHWQAAVRWRSPYLPNAALTTFSVNLIFFFLEIPDNIHSCT